MMNLSSRAEKAIKCNQQGLGKLPLQYFVLILQNFGHRKSALKKWTTAGLHVSGDTRRSFDLSGNAAAATVQRGY